MGSNAKGISGKAINKICTNLRLIYYYKGKETNNSLGEALGKFISIYYSLPSHKNSWNINFWYQFKNALDNEI